MNDKTFLQELESIKQKLARIVDKHVDAFDEIDINVKDGINDCMDDIQGMINKCIEIQLMMMKQEKTKKLYDTKDF